MVEYNIWKWFQSVKTFYTLCKSNVFGGKGLASVAGSILHGFNTEESDGLIFGSSGRMQAHFQSHLELMNTKSSPGIYSKGKKKRETVKLQAKIS